MTIVSSKEVARMLEESKEALTQRGLVPSDCPAPNNCLSFHSLDLSYLTATVTLFARPPELPTTVEGLRYEVHPQCKNNCGILGNSNRTFVITVDMIDGNIRTTESDWKR